MFISSSAENNWFLVFQIEIVCCTCWCSEHNTNSQVRYIALYDFKVDHKTIWCSTEKFAATIVPSLMEKEWLKFEAHGLENISI